jgi:predicted secreted hydrolase
MPFAFDMYEPPDILTKLAERGRAELAELGSGGLAQVVLPEDETAHPTRNEWWYFKGHVRTKDDGKPFSFLAVVLKQRIVGADVTLGIYKRIDHAGGKRSSPAFHRAQRLASTYAGSVDPIRTRFEFGSRNTGVGSATRWSVTSQSKGLEDGYRLEADGEFGLDLELVERSPACLIGPGGIVDYGGAETLAYYLRPDLAVQGVMPVDGEVREVVGTGWMEHQWGHADVRKFAWKFIAIQLDHGDRWMFFRVVHPRAAGTMFYGARLRNGRTEVVPAQLLEVKDDLKSGFKSGATTYRTSTFINVFPDAVLGVKALSLVVRPVFEEQLFESNLPGVPTFWEGACTVTGTHDGRDVSGFAMTEIT